MHHQFRKKKREFEEVVDGDLNTSKSGIAVPEEQHIVVARRLEENTTGFHFLQQIDRQIQYRGTHATCM